MSKLARYLRRLLSSSGSQTKEPRATTPEDSKPANGTSNLNDSCSTTSSLQLVNVKYVDHVYNTASNVWEYVDTATDLLAEAVTPFGTAAGSGDWQDYCFVVVRRFPAIRGPEDKIAFRIIIKSTYLLQACKSVIGNVSGISWNSDPLELTPELLLTFFPQLEKYAAKLRADSATQDSAKIATALQTLVDYLRKNYRNTLAQIENLTKHGEITFELLYAVLIPRTVCITRCTKTGEPRALKLITATKESSQRGEYYSLWCNGVEVASEEDDDDTPAAPGGSNIAGAFGLDQVWVEVKAFKGTRKISSLFAFPLEYHPDASAIREKLVRRGRKWAVLNGIHHVFYKGLGTDGEDNKYSVNGRIIIDRYNFMRINPNVGVPRPDADVRCEQFALDEYLNAGEGVHRSYLIPNDEMLLLASPILYGFSLSDKVWLKFNVEKITPIEWNKETFEGLVLPTDRKALLRSLVEAHNADSAFDDFVRGKGQGLVINLFGPPGVGKTLSAEATSEHIRRPLYVVGSGDLGTTPSALDNTLKEVFDVAACWDAIVLIDEADVFLEQRSVQNLQRNAMVAVFLRHIEYYRGILFLTTNRITTFDEAFLSRIHVALHYTELSTATKAQIWRAFLKKAGVAQGRISEERVQKLAERDANGRQIKNACRTATSLARSRGVDMQYEHLVEALDAMEEFVVQFAALRAQSSGGESGRTQGTA